MKKRLLALALWTALAVFLAGCAAGEGAGAAGQAPEKRILVVETTDIHGYIMDVSSGSQEKFTYRLARIAQLIREARASGAYDEVLLLDGGDLYQGTPPSLMTGGAVIRAALGAMDYDAVALGNHEFDWGAAEYAADADGTIPPWVLGDDFGDPAIPVLASNLFDAATGERSPITRDYAIIEKAGLRIAVIGYIPDYSSDIMTTMIAPYRIDPDLNRLNALVRQVWETEKPDAAIVLAHEDPRLVAEGLDPALVCLVAGGHTHKSVAETSASGIPCIQGGFYAQGFATAVLTVGADGSVRAEDPGYTDITAEADKLVDPEANAAYLDAEIVRLARAGWDAISEEMNEVLGYIDTPVVRKRAVGANSAGNWITGVFRQATRDLGTMMAFYNSGGIRANFLIPPDQTRREITVGDIYTIAPFGNTLLVFELSGQELARLLADGLTKSSFGDQMTGLTFTYSATGDPSMDRAEREYTILSITLEDGTPVDLNGTEPLYRVCTTDFSATLPGCVFEGKTPLVLPADAPVDNESIIRVLREAREASDGYIPVDTGPRGVEILPE